jgi:hypothetical protein
MFPYKNFYFKWGQYTCGAPERLTEFGARTYHNNNRSQSTVDKTVEHRRVVYRVAEPAPDNYRSEPAAIACMTFFFCAAFCSFEWSHANRMAALLYSLDFFLSIQPSIHTYQDMPVGGPCDVTRVGIHISDFADFIMDLCNRYSQSRLYIGFTR